MPHARTDLVTALVLLAFLALLAGAAAATAIHLEVNHSCPLDYGRCHTPNVTLGSQVSVLGAAAAVLGATVWVAVGAAKGWPVRHGPLLGAVLVLVTFLGGRVIATWT